MRCLLGSTTSWQFWAREAALGVVVVVGSVAVVAAWLGATMEATRTEEAAWSQKRD